MMKLLSTLASPRRTRHTTPLFALVALVLSGCHVISTRPDPVPIDDASAVRQIVGSDCRWGTANSDSPVEHYYTPNPFFGHVVSLSSVSSGRRAWLIATFDRPLTGRIGTDYIVNGSVANIDSGAVILATEGREHVAYREYNYLRRVPEGAFSVHVIRRFLILGFDADLLPEHPAYRSINLRSPDPEQASPFGIWISFVRPADQTPVSAR